MRKFGALLAAAAATAGAAGATAWFKRRREGEELDLEVADPTLGDAHVPSVTSEPEPVPSGGPDDLTSLKGLGAVTAGKLGEHGVTTFTQIAAWTDEDIADVGMKIGVSPGRIKREDWVGQARTAAEG